MSGSGSAVSGDGDAMYAAVLVYDSYAAGGTLVGVGVGLGVESSGDSRTGAAVDDNSVSDVEVGDDAIESMAVAGGSA